MSHSGSNNQAKIIFRPTFRHYGQKSAKNGQFTAVISESYEKIHYGTIFGKL